MHHVNHHRVASVDNCYIYSFFNTLIWNVSWSQSSWKQTREQTAWMSVYNLSPRLRACLQNEPGSSAGRIYHNCTRIYRLCTAIEPKMHDQLRKRSMELLLNIMWLTILQSNDKDLFTVEYQPQNWRNFLQMWRTTNSLHVENSPHLEN